MKTIPAPLQAHYDSGQTTLCYLLKIVPLQGAAFGVTSLDVDVDYDDGGGELTYSAVTGANVSAIESSSTLAVNNAEAMLLIDTDLTQADINAGVLDYAKFYLYRINWANKSDGHELRQAGRTGQVRAHNELAGIIELRGLAQQLKQNYIDQYSLPCRARFGSALGEELFPCLFDASTLWQTLGVGAVGTETDREFTADGTPAATGPNGALPFVVATLKFLTGANAGLTVETETVAGAAITLRFPTPYAIEIGDSFQIRPDCEKRFAEDCVALFDNGLNFRGEPWIPLTEEAPGQSPGAYVKGLGAPPSTPDPIPDPSPVPPDPAPDISGAVTWESVFGRGFGEQVVADVTRVIPYNGLAIWFQVPDTSDSVEVIFDMIEVTGGINSTLTGSVNTGVLDFSSPVVSTLGLSGNITGGINKAGLDRILVPGNIYIFNCRNNEPNDPNTARLRVSYVVD